MDNKITEEVVVFDKYNYIDCSNSDLEELFLATLDTSGSIEDHMENMEERIPLYHVRPLWKYEHGDICYEAAPSCCFYSGLIGVIAILKTSEITMEEIISDMNEQLTLKSLDF